ncbi:MAG: class I SAM-dependent methyltransferase [Geobacteraceae bacterium]|nr:class I SAM-dependent methyltransferase [Geobacteraceae bacterium]
MELSFHPSLSPDQANRNLSTLLVRGTIQNSALDSAIKRLDERFRSYCALYPHGLWAPGLVVTSEMRGSTEQYLPMTEIRSAFSRFFPLALRYPLQDENNPFSTASNWLDLLQRFRLSKEAVNPAALLRKLIFEESFRIRFLFSSLLPKHHGGNFSRYPEQISFLEGWITQRRAFLPPETDTLDAACGTGEGTYDVAGLLLKCGTPSRAQRVHGCSLEPLEVFAAAHGCFPHDPGREERFHSITAPLFTAQATSGMLFFQDNIMRQPTREEKPYDIILCNGLLGGPFLHGPDMLENAIAALTKRLKAGGVLLTADRFHEGWKKGSPPALIEEIMQHSGLVVQRGDFGIAAEKK